MTESGFYVIYALRAELINAGGRLLNRAPYRGQGDEHDLWASEVFMVNADYSERVVLISGRGVTASHGAKTSETSLNR